MSKKFLASVTLALATAFSATSAFADQPIAAHAAEKLMVADRRGNDIDVLDTQRAGARSGSLVLSMPRGSRDADLAIVSSDPRLAIGRVMVTYAGGKTLMLRSTGAGAIELPSQGRIASIRVQYVNRGARGAVVKLIARNSGNDRGDRDGNGRGDRGGNGRGDGNGRDGGNGRGGFGGR